MNINGIGGAGYAPQITPLQSGPSQQVQPDPNQQKPQTTPPQPEQTGPRPGAVTQDRGNNLNIVV
jgi:hypothetical protein